MTLLIGVTLLGFCLGLLLPLRWGLVGFLLGVVLLFLVQAGVNTAMGFEGTPISESLLLFNDSWVAYVGFNMQITYRAFAPPVIALAAVLIWRLARARA